MPTVIHPMLATSTPMAFDNPTGSSRLSGTATAPWPHREGHVRLVSRTQNDLTAQFVELGRLPQFVKAQRAILDGEIVALDDKGLPSFSLMQQRTGFQPGKRRLPRLGYLPAKARRSSTTRSIFSISTVSTAARYPGAAQQLLQERSSPATLRTFPTTTSRKVSIFSRRRSSANWKGLSPRNAGSIYEEKRSRDWLKIKITQRQECVIGGYTDPEGSRDYFGALVLGLFDQKGRLIHRRAGWHRIRSEGS